MQQTVFSPGCYSSGDVNVAANGGTWLLCNNDRSSKNVHPYNMFLPPPTRDQYFGYGKDTLRRAMIEHDATFRDQVHALHRLYRRQWELMREVKRIEVAKNQSVQSNPFPSQNPVTYPLNIRQLQSVPPVQTFTNLQEPSGGIRWSTNNGSDPARAEKCLRESDLLDPKGKKSKRKVFDLELPADEFIDDEEWEGSGEKVSEVPSYQPNSNFKPFPCSGLSNSVFQEASSFSSSFPRRINYLADLNEPIKLKNAISPNSSEMQVLSMQKDRQRELGPHNHEAVLDFLPEQRCNAKSLLQVSSSRNLSMSSIPSQFQHSAQLLGARINRSCVPAPFDPSSLMKLTHVMKENPSEVQALPYFNNAHMPIGKSSKSSEGIFGLDGNKFQIGNRGCIPNVASVSFLGNSSHLPSQPESRTFEAQPRSISFNSKCSRGSDNEMNNMNVVDLNFLPPSSFSEIATSQQNIGTKKLENSFGGLPWLNTANPDYKAKADFSNIDSISSPAFTTSIRDSLPNPSEEKDVERSDKLSWFGNHFDLNSCLNEEDEASPKQPLSPENQECSPPRGESEENQVEVPLQALNLEHRAPQEEHARLAAETIVLLASSSSPVQRPTEEITVCDEPLHWFADVACLQDKEIFSDGSDYFETMTLKLPEAKVEEYFYANTIQRVEETGLNSSRRARSRRVRQRKDFQTEILPSLASLSRHEVTEDFQSFEGLMEDFETGLRRRNSGRKGGSNKGKKQRRKRSNNLVEGEDCSLSNLVAGWGKKNGRQRGRRFPVSNPNSIIFCLH